ncbi:unnamed protein product [Moneuplotes crassus]|uniref:Uncharacterized protein n=1 Tax=Euplotes crassus TaxID=5936 RepID=A0AAD1Y9N0_EUPCR|nr:unnamed protein product [Moneuplotes crassus]
MTQTISFKELSDIMYDACMLEHSMYSEPFRKILEENYQIADYDKIPVKTVYKALEHCPPIGELATFPAATNRISGGCNIELIKASIQIIKKGLMNRMQIKEAVQAYLYTTREIGKDWIPLDPEIIVKCFRTMGKSMSKKSIQKWIEEYFKDKEFHEIKEEPPLTGYKYTDDCIKDRPVKPADGLYPHEFIFLVAHADNRIRKLKEFPSSLKMLKSETQNKGVKVFLLSKNHRTKEAYNPIYHMNMVYQKMSKDFKYKAGYDFYPDFKIKKEGYPTPTPKKEKRGASLYTIKGEKQAIASLKLNISYIENSLNNTYQFLNEPHTINPNMLQKKNSRRSRRSRPRKIGQKFSTTSVIKPKVFNRTLSRQGTKKPTKSPKISSFIESDSFAEEFEKDHFQSKNTTNVTKVPHVYDTIKENIKEKEERLRRMKINPNITTLASDSATIDRWSKKSNISTSVTRRRPQTANFYTSKSRDKRILNYNDSKRNFSSKKRRTQEKSFGNKPKIKEAWSIYHGTQSGFSLQQKNSKWSVYEGN